MALEIKRFGALSYVRFAPRQLGVVFAPADGEGNVECYRASDVLSLPGVEAVLDGPMYAESSSGACRLSYLYYDRAKGLWYPGRFPARGMTFSVAGNQVQTAHHAQYLGTPDVAVQTYPELVWDGRNVASASVNTSREWRAGVGLMPDGSMVLAVAQNHMHGFAQQLIDLGVSYAGYTDGGGSTTLQVAGGERVGHPDDRPVASWLIVRRDVEPVGPFALSKVAPLFYLDRVAPLLLAPFKHFTG